MKNKKLKFLPIILLGISMASCDLQMGTIGLATISKYSNEVTYSEFVKTLVKYVNDSKYGSESFKLEDTLVKAEVNGNLKQKVTNTSYKDSTRNEAKVKTRADGKCTFDADNQVLECALKLGVSLKEENPLLGKADASYKNTLNYGGMPNGENKYALFNKEAGVFWNVPLEDDYSMAKTAAEYVKAGVLVLNELAENFTDDMINDVIKEFNSDKLTVALKCYVDDRVLTTVGTVEYSTALTKQEYVDEEYKEVTYGTVHFSGEWIVQAKLDATLKFATSIKGNVEANFVESRSSVLDDFIPTISGLVVGDCAKGDKETIDVNIVAGVSIEQKDITTEKPDLSGYKEIK